MLSAKQAFSDFFDTYNTLYNSTTVSAHYTGKKLKGLLSKGGQDLANAVTVESKSIVAKQYIPAVPGVIGREAGNSTTPNPKI